MIKRNTLGLSIAAMFRHDLLDEAFGPSLCSVTELMPSVVTVIGPAPATLPAVSAPGGGTIRNFSFAQQAPAAATLTYLTGSALNIPFPGMRRGTYFRWRFNMAKTAAGTALSTFDIRVGTLGTVADTARVTFTKPAGTAAADEGWCEINATCRVRSATVGVIAGTFTLGHNLAATGHAVIPFVAVTVISGNFDNTAYPQIVGLTITSGAADAITIEQMQAEAGNLG